jgi:hypothetical protein
VGVEMAMFLCPEYCKVTTQSTRFPYQKLMKTLSVIGFLFAPLISKAQTNQEILAELNRDIWKPFIEGVNTNKPELYNGVNSTDFYWVLDGAKPRIMNLPEYIEDARIVMQSRISKGIATNLNIRFLQRNANKDFASEKCIIQYTSTSPGKQPEVFYSIAHSFSRKENGTWKKLIQHANTEAATKEMFEAAQPIE